MGCLVEQPASSVYDLLVESGRVGEGGTGEEATMGRLSNRSLANDVPRVLPAYRGIRQVRTRTEGWGWGLHSAHQGPSISVISDTLMFCLLLGGPKKGGDYLKHDP